MDRFDTSVSLLISATVGAGVFALPILAKTVGLSSVFIILAAFAYMLGLGYLIIGMFPGSVEDEVERHLGERARAAIILVEYAIVFLALTAYLVGLKSHLGVSNILMFIVVAIPLIMQLHFPASFTNILAFFILAFVSSLTLIAIPGMELPAKFIDVATLITPTGMQAAVFLFLASSFAFYGHNMIPRVRNIIRNKKTTERVFYTAISIVFLLYLPFSVAVSGLGADDMATSFLVRVLSEPWSALTNLLAVIIFYTSFVLFGLKVLDDIGNTGESITLVIVGTAVLYYMTQLASIPFHLIVSAAGLGVSIYAFLVSLSAVRAKKHIPVAYSNLVFTTLLWISLILQFF